MKAPPRRHEGETVGDYFLPDRSEQIVRRGELLAILTHIEKRRADDVWHKRAWRGMQQYFITSARAPLAEPEAK